jgi:hypothetical protein
MKKYLFGFFCFFFGASQIQAQLVFQNDSVYLLENPVPSVEVVVKNFVINNSSNTVTYRWWRISEDIPAAWETSMICDEETCWAPTVNTNELTVAAGDSALLDVHFQNIGRAGQGTVELLVFDVADSTDTYMIAKYVGKAENTPTSINTISKNTLKVYPNPAENFINILLPNPNATALIEIFSIIGVKVAEHQHNNKPIDVGRLQNGVYMIKVTDEQSKASYSQTFIKR